MNYYLKRRLQCGLTKTDMANELGLDYLRYSAIERGDVKMPTNLIEKFNEIINRGKENEIAKTENEIKADEFWKEVSQKGDEDKWVLVSKMREFNIRSYRDLAELLGYKSEGIILNYLSGRNPVGIEFKKRLYNFFSDEKNIQIPVKAVEYVKPIARTTKEKEVNKELDDYYNNTNFKQLLKEHHITNRQIATVIGVHDSTISGMVSKKTKPSYKIIQNVKDYLDSVISDSAVKDVKEEKHTTNYDNKYISKQKILDECESEIEENRIKVEELQKQIAEIEAKIELTSKVIEVIKGL